MIAQTSSHAWRDLQSLVDSSEIVVYGVDRNHGRVILNFEALPNLPSVNRWAAAIV